MEARQTYPIDEWMTWHITDVPSSRSVYHICVSVAKLPAHVHSRSFGSSSPKRVSGVCADETGWKFCAVGSTGGDVLWDCEV